VYHHHGIHHGNKRPARVSGVLNSINDSIDVDNELLPPTFTIGHSRVSFLFITSSTSRVTNFFSEDRINSLQGLTSTDFPIYLVTPQIVDEIAHLPVKQIVRSELSVSTDRPLGEFIYSIAERALQYGPVQDLFVFANLDYTNLSVDLMEELLYDMQRSNFDMLTYATPTADNIWFYSETKNTYVPVENILYPRVNRKSPMRSFFGIGTVFNLTALTSGSFPANVTGLKTLPSSFTPQRLS